MKSENNPVTYQGLLGLDKTPKEIKIINWVICFMMATIMAFWGYSRIFQALFSLYSSPIHIYLEGLAVISPTCIAVAWLRITGLRWRHTLLLFLFVPMAFKAILFVFDLLGSIMMND